MAEPQHAGQSSQPWAAMRAFVHTEAASGVVLIAAALLALILSNSPAAPAYQAALHQRLGPMSVHHWINDGLMALFFLLVGLELKRELLSGALASWQDRLLPGAAAIAGMAVPALLYLAVAGGQSGPAAPGWAIPAATDIAFALGILALLGPRVPPSLKILLTAIAVIDDLGAILVIALFLTDHIVWLPLAGAAVAIAMLFALNRSGVGALWPYLAVAAGLWATVLLSGVHSTMAGVIAAGFIPLAEHPGGGDAATSPLHQT